MRKEQFLGLGEITVCGAITPKRLIAISSIQDLPEKSISIKRLPKNFICLPLHSLSREETKK